MKKYYLLSMMLLSMSTGFCSEKADESTFYEGSALKKRRVEFNPATERPQFEQMLDKIFVPTSPLQIVNLLRQQAEELWVKLSSEENTTAFFKDFGLLTKSPKLIKKALLMLEGYKDDTLFANMLLKAKTYDFRLYSYGYDRKALGLAETLAFNYINQKKATILDYVDTPLTGQDSSTMDSYYSACMYLTFEQVLAFSMTADKFFTDEVDINSRTHLIKKLKGLTPEQIKASTQAIEDHAANLFEDDMSASKRSHIIAACMPLSMDQVKAVGDLKDDLFKDLTASKRGLIIKSCKLLTPEQIKDRSQAIQDHADILFKEEMTGKDRSYIIAACMLLTPEHIKALSVLKDDIYEGMNGYDRSRIIKACQPLSPADMVARIQAFQKVKDSFFADEAYLEIFCDTVVHFMHLTPEQIAIIGSFYTSEMDNEACDNLTDVTLRLTPEQVAAIGTCKDILMERMTPLQRYKALEVLRKLKPEQIADLGTSITNSSRKEKTGRMRLEAIKRFAELKGIKLK